MNSHLKRVYEQTIEIYRADERIVAAWEYGSIGKGTADQYSDVDPVFVVKDDHFADIDREMEGLFKSLSPEIVLWWPESMNCDEIKNYAIFLKKDGCLSQYDNTIATVKSVRNGMGRFMLTQCGKVEILFDKIGLLSPILQEEPHPQYTPEKLLWHIERYWIYVYIHIKYLMRGDPFKLLYAQRELFNDHMAILNALYPHEYWSWWVVSARHALNPSQQEAVLRYFGPGDAPAVAHALRQEIDDFSRDAQAACRAWGLSYPLRTESEVRASLLPVLQRLG